MPEFSSPGGPLRVTLVRAWESCPLAAKWQTETDHASVRMDLGTVFHAIAAEVLRALYQYGGEAVPGKEGWARVPSEEAFVIAREVYSRPDMPPLPSKERRELAMLVRQFVAQAWPMSRIWLIEKRLMCEVAGPDGVLRTLTGKPDVIFTDPPDGFSVVDHKTGYERPPKPKVDEPQEWNRDNGRPYLGAGGSTQLDLYGLLVLKNKPDAKYVTLEEHHWRWGETRRATLWREELEHVEVEIGTHLMKMEAMLQGRAAAVPRAGAHCLTRCPRPRDCPIPPVERGEGAIINMADMEAYGEQWLVRNAQKADADKKLKAAIEAGMPEPVVNGTAVGWVYNENGGRSFKPHSPA